MIQLRALSAFVIVAAAAPALLAQEPQPAKPKVVFVCEHGAAKSILAAAELEKMAKDRGLDIQVLARGTNIDPELSSAVVAGLKADGLTPLLPKPIQVSPADLTGAVRIVTFGPNLSALAPKSAQVLDWSATPSTGENYTAARDYIRKELEKLLPQLKAAKPVKPVK